jgi:hypothetical protein
MTCSRAGLLETVAGAAGLLAAGLLAVGCGDSPACDAELAVRLEAVVQGGDRLTDNARVMRLEVLSACRSIAEDLEEMVPPQGAEESNDDYLMEVCGLAAMAIDAEVSAGAVITISYQRPWCWVDAQAQLACEASCDVSGMCDPGTVEARCEPADLSVYCEGICEAGAYCEAQVGSAPCDGVCDGQCWGDCEGFTNAAGQCVGTCSGMCFGSCLIEAEGGVVCDYGATCRGGCTGAYQAPDCHSDLMPSPCDIDADCQAGCAAQGNFNVRCFQGYVGIHVEGSSSARLALTLREHLLVLIPAAFGMADFFGGIEAFGDAAARVSIAVSESATCHAAEGERIAATVEAAPRARATVDAAVAASAAVTASAGLMP